MTKKYCFIFSIVDCFTRSNSFAMTLKQKNMQKKIFIVAGGTGGHVFPALSIYQELISSGTQATFIADERGQRYLKPEINQKKLCIKASGSGAVKKLVALITMGFAFLQSLCLLATNRPNIIIGFGGYPTVPVILAAKLFGKKIYIHEQNSVLGKANILGTKFAEKIFLSFEGTKCLNKKYNSKAIVVGNPVRKEIAALADSAYQPIEQGSKINILVTGGSQGSNIFNETVPKAIANLPEELKSRIHITQQARKESLEQVKNFYQVNNISCEVSNFFENIHEKLKDAHLVICRSGASTIAELAVAGKPVILVPLKNSAHNHQKINAEYLVNKNAAIMLEENEFEQQSLSKILEDLFLKESKLKNYSANIKKLAKLNVTSKILANISS